jgi:hypothetical protein
VRFDYYKQPDICFHTDTNELRLNGVVLKAANFEDACRAFDILVACRNHIGDLEVWRDRVADWLTNSPPPSDLRIEEHIRKWTR